MGFEHAVAQTVESPHPQAFDIQGQHRLQTREHFLGRLVGEGHGQDAARRDLTGLHQPGDAGGEHARLARARTGENQGMLARQRHCGGLLRVEML